MSEHINDYTGERRENAFQSIEYLRDGSIILQDIWENKLKKAEGLVGENKDAPIMAAFLLPEIDILVTSDLKDFPHDDFEYIVTPNQFLSTF